MEGCTETEENAGEKGMKKERLIYLDVIKAIALVFVFSCHFTRSLEANGVGFVCKVLPDQIFDLYIGSFGVTLFFIASGASLMYVYGEKLDWTVYLKKRFTGIYPMFWIAFLTATFISFFRDGGIRKGVPGWKIIFSILGIDGNTLGDELLPPWRMVPECDHRIVPVVSSAADRREKISCRDNGGFAGDRRALYFIFSQPDADGMLCPFPDRGVRFRYGHDLVLPENKNLAVCVRSCADGAGRHF